MRILIISAILFAMGCSASSHYEKKDDYIYEPPKHTETKTETDKVDTNAKRAKKLLRSIRKR